MTSLGPCGELPFSSGLLSLSSRLPGSRLPVINEYFPSLGPKLGDVWDVALAVVGRAGVWGALERGLQLFTWQGLACRCETAGVGGEAKEWGGTQREASAFAPLQEEPMLWPHVLPERTPAHYPVFRLFCYFQNQAPEGGSAASSCLQMLVQFLPVPVPPEY